jgi:transaldolase
VRRGLSGEALFFELAVQDLTRAADLFGPIHERTAGVDGWLSLEVSPLLAYDAKATVAEADGIASGSSCVGRWSFRFSISPGSREKWHLFGT